MLVQIPDPGSVPSWVCLGKLLLSFPICVYVYVCVHAQSCLTLCDPWTIACQPPLSMEFSRQQYWSELPFPPPGDLPNSRIEPESPALASRFFITTPPGKPYIPSYTQGILKVRGKMYNNQQGRHHLTIDSWKGSNFSPACLSTSIPILRVPAIPLRFILSS